MRSVYLTADTINGIVKKIEKRYVQDKLKDGDTLIVNIKKSQINDLPIKNNDLYKKYFENMDKRWTKKNNDWYFSYYRRLIEKRFGISQFEQAIESLCLNGLTRRSVLCASDILDNELYRPALLTISFSIRNKKLDMIVHWRSQELFYAFPINTIVMYSFEKIFLKKLKSFYKFIEFGEYIQYVDNVCVHATINKEMVKIQDIWKQIDYSLENELCFMWSIIKKNKEDEYDENY